MSETPVTSLPQQAAIASWMIDHIGKVLGVPADGFPVAASFDSYGVDSVEAVIMAGLLEEEFAVPIDPVEMFDHPSVAAFSAHLAARIAERQV